MDGEHSEDVGETEEAADGGEGGRPRLQPPGELLLAAEAPLHAGDVVAALEGHGLEGVDEVVGAVRAAAADLGDNKTDMRL